MTLLSVAQRILKPFPKPEKCSTLSNECLGSKFYSPSPFCPLLQPNVLTASLQPHRNFFLLLVPPTTPKHHHWKLSKCLDSSCLTFTISVASQLEGSTTKVSSVVIGSKDALVEDDFCLRGATSSRKKRKKLFLIWILQVVELGGKASYSLGLMLNLEATPKEILQPPVRPDQWGSSLQGTEPGRSLNFSRVCTNWDSSNTSHTDTGELAFTTSFLAQGYQIASRGN